MCTIIAISRHHPTLPLIVAANRDEWYAREATPPQVLHDSPRVVAGKDVSAGGTWLGAAGTGLFVGLTNQRQWGPKPRRPRSRGRLVLDALSSGSVAGVHALLDASDPRELGELNLFYGDATQLHVAYGRHDAGRFVREAVGPGVHVLANDVIGSPHFPKATRAERRVAEVAKEPWDRLRPELEEVLADGSTPPLAEVPEPPAGAVSREFARRLQAICVRTPEYGTRSATLLAIDEGGVREHLFADGAPDETRFEDVRGLY